MKEINNNFHLEPLPPNPLISIVVPSYNQGAFIRQTLQACLDQDYRPIEIVVMDGASTDHTVEVLKSFGNLPELRWVSEPDKGVVDAVNKGLRAARGDIACIQSSDDFHRPGCFSTVTAAFRDNPEAGLVFGDVERVDPDNRVVYSPRQARFSLARLLARQLYIYQPTAFFRRDLALELGGWNPDIPYVPDIDLWIRLAFHAPVVQCDAVLAAYRTHPGQRDQHRDRIYRDYRRMLELSKELPAASRRLRRAAQAGAELMKFRYGGPWTNAQLTRAAWKALWLRPSLLFSPKLPFYRLIPGYFTLTGWRRQWLGPKKGA